MLRSGRRHGRLRTRLLCTAAVLALSLAACGGGPSGAFPDDCPGGISDYAHTDYEDGFEGFDTPEAAVAAVARGFPEVPRSVTEGASVTGDEGRLVVVDETGRAIAEAVAQRTGGGGWVVSDLAWCL